MGNFKIGLRNSNQAYEIILMQPIFQRNLYIGISAGEFILKENVVFK
jgi:hypothetical protein